MNTRPVIYISVFCLIKLLATPAMADSAAHALYANWLGLDGGAVEAPAADFSQISPPPATPARVRDALPDLPRLQHRQGPSYSKNRTRQTATTEPSRLETYYAGRISEDIEQFGYDLFSRMPPHRAPARPGLPGGAAQDDFILSSGDRLNIIIRGQRNEQSSYVVDSQGLLIVDELPPVPAAGRTIAQVREALEAYVSLHYNTDIFIALDSVRQIDVLVIGDVERPGRQTLTVFHTTLDALEEAGGIKKTGSLRRIRLVRDGRSTIIDLYGLLIHGSTNMDLQLRDGDRIIVPAIGPTIGVAGGVKRPGIYELPYYPGGLGKSGGMEQRLSLQDALDLAGGRLSPGQARHIRLSLHADGREMTEEVSNHHLPLFSDGDILTVAPSEEVRTETVELAGHTRRPGIHALSRVPTLSALLDNERVAGPDIYPLVGVIERRDSARMIRQMIAFPPLEVIKGRFDRRLEDGDLVRLFSRAQILALQARTQDEDTGQAAQGSPDHESDDVPITDSVLRAFLTERTVTVRGAVRQPGGWPVAEDATLDQLIAVAGGLTIDAETGNIEISARGPGGSRRTTIDSRETDLATVSLQPGDTVRVNQKPQPKSTQSVLLIGQVKQPGHYDLLPGDRLSDLLARAGGLTPQAYPIGAVFSRGSERRAEEMRFRAQAQSLEMKLATALEQPDERPDMARIMAVQDLITQLRQAEGLGRITVEADPAALAANPALDILLEGGDRIYIPQRPLTVRVAGEILSPASLQFREGKNPRDYIAEAGGFTWHADKGRTFVLYPDGSAQPLQVSAWNHSAAFIPPGSTIIVPRDPKPFDFIQTARDVSQILTNLAITALFIDEIRD